MCSCVPTLDVKEPIGGGWGSGQGERDAGVDILIKRSQRQQSFVKRFVFTHVQLGVEVVDDWWCVSHCHRHVTVHIIVVIKTDSGSYNRHVTVQIIVVIKTDSGSYNRHVTVQITWQVKQTVVVTTDM